MKVCSFALVLGIINASISPGRSSPARNGRSGGTAPASPMKIGVPPPIPFSPPDLRVGKPGPMRKAPPPLPPVNNRYGFGKPTPYKARIVPTFEMVVSSGSEKIVDSVYNGYENSTISGESVQSSSSEEESRELEAAFKAAVEELNDDNGSPQEEYASYVPLIPAEILAHVLSDDAEVVPVLGASQEEYIADNTEPSSGLSYDSVSVQEEERPCTIQPQNESSNGTRSVWSSNSDPALCPNDEEPLKALWVNYVAFDHDEQETVAEQSSSCSSPHRSPRNSPRASPRPFHHSPQQSPIQSPIQSPRSSPRPSRQSPIPSLRQSPCSSARQSPRNSPRPVTVNSPGELSTLIETLVPAERSSPFSSPRLSAVRSLEACIESLPYHLAMDAGDSSEDSLLKDADTSSSSSNGGFTRRNWNNKSKSAQVQKNSHKSSNSPPSERRFTSEEGSSPSPFFRRSSSEDLHEFGILPRGNRPPNGESFFSDEKELESSGSTSDSEHRFWKPKKHKKQSKTKGGKKQNKVKAQSINVVVHNRLQIPAHTRVQTPAQTFTPSFLSSPDLSMLLIALILLLHLFQHSNSVYHHY